LNYLRFFLANWKILLFAVLFTFFSGFGQTFLLSLYIPGFLKDLSFSHTFYSSLYASATLLSGITIIFAGKMIDRLPLKTFAFAVIFGIVSANVVAGFSFNALSLFVAIFMLRFFGQGLLSHTAMTAMGRYFSKARGKALSIAYLGFPIAEGSFPILVLTLITTFGWRQSFFISASTIFLILLPSTFLLLKNFNKETIKEDLVVLNIDKTTTITTANERQWAQKEVLKTAKFYLFAPTTFIVGFTLTALFFFQTYIAEYKGWSIEWMALNITAYAVSSFIFSIAAGPITDRLRAKRVYPFILLPMLMGLGCLILFSHPIAATAFWFLVGVSAGLNPTVSNALYAETYGTLSLGSVRSLFTFVMVGSTALGPIFYSLMLDNGYSFNSIHTLLIVIITINLLGLLLSNRFKRYLFKKK
jgi:MFS family permease